MKTQRIVSAVLSLALCSQTVCLLPAGAMSDTAECDLSAFADQVQTLVQTDAARDIFTELVYDPAAGTLTADDGAASAECGDLLVQDGELKIRQGSSTVPFTDAPEAYGYRASVDHGAVTLTNDFQTARLIVKAAGQIDPHGAVSSAEGYRDLHILQYETPAQAYAAYQIYLADSSIEYVQPSHQIALDDSAGTETPETDAKEYMSWGGPLIGTDSFIKEYLSDKELPEVVVAVVDTGINTAPPAFDGRIQDGGINVSNSGDDTARDDSSHGTHVSGTICELTTDNVKILPIKVFNDAGKASEEQIYLGIMYALEQGADILNMSFGGLGVYPLEVEAMNVANEHDIICCAASGNNGDNAGYFYPGGIESCITVGGVTADMKRVNNSNFGDVLDVVAPGENVLSYVLGTEGEKDRLTGTSMATPHVTACCALLKSYDKTMKPDRAEALLRLNAVDIGEPGFDRDCGWGFVNMNDFRWDDGICKAPVFSKKSGNFGGPQTVSLQTETPEAEIYYTTDGTVPDPENGTLYTEPLVISETTQILAIAVREGFITSVPAEAVYQIGGKDVADAFTAENGVLTRCRSVCADLVIPDTLDGVPVTAVAANAFAGNHFVQNVTLPDSVKTLGDRAFAECAILETVTARGVTELGTEAFAEDAALKSAELAAKQTAVGAGAFQNCASMKTLTLAGISAIPEKLCSGCVSLGSAELPDAVSFGDAAFSDCAALKEIHADWKKITAIGADAFANCRAWSGDLPLTALETIGAGAFSGDRNLLRVSLPETITVLPECAFAGCGGLRLLQLPGVTVLEPSSLALGGSRSDLESEINWEQIRAVGADALNGMTVGNGFETVTFSALETLVPQSFAGVSAGALAFPQIREVPENAVAGASVYAAYLEQAEQLASKSITGCRAVVLSSAMQEIAADAYSENEWLVTPAPLPLPEEVPVAYRTCNEPLVMRYSTLSQTVPAHRPAACAVLVCGTGLTYQWYAVTGDERTAIDGETSYLFYADTSKAGTYSYLCEIRDAGGNTETVPFEVTVTDAAETDAITEDEEICKTGTDLQYTQITVSQDGLYRITASGAAAVTGVLSDASGQIAAKLKPDTAGFSLLTAELKAGEIYLLETTGKWDGSYTVCCSADTQMPRYLSECTLTVKERGTAQYGTQYDPVITLTAPDGTVLQENRDYTVRITQRNQFCTVSVFGTGTYSGYAEKVLAVYPRVPTDTPVPVSLKASNDSGIYCFVPKTTGKYYFYATYGSGFAEEVARYSRVGRYPSTAVYAPIRTNCIVSDQYDGTGTILAQNSYSVKTGSFFNSSVQLYAGQPYYFICKATTAAEYALVVSENPPPEISSAKVSAGAYANYEEGKSFTPEVRVKMNGELLTEGVDYQVLNLYNDKPGMAEVTVYGMGRYIGSVTRKYEIMYASARVPEQLTELDTPVTVNCANGRIETIWFETTAAEKANEALRYRVINERLSGGNMTYQLYQYDERSKTASMVMPMKDETDDYRLRNGKYFIVVSKLYPDVACTARFTVMQPYDLESVQLIYENAPYTGAPVDVPLKVVTEDGRELEKNRDYLVSYPDENTMFGTTSFSVTDTKRSFGRNGGEFEIYVEIPEEVPELTIGDHTAKVTLEDRLAFYKITPETDMHYVLSTSDVPNIVLRVFSPEAEMLSEVHGSGAKALTFDVPAGETRYIMVKFNLQLREGSIHFRLDTETRLLKDCEAETSPQIWTGLKIAPNVVFRDGDYTLQENVDYKLRYTADDTNIGTATANYTGIGKYFGLCDVEYEIISPDVITSGYHESIPLLLGQPQTFDCGDKSIYVLAHYTPGIQTDLNIRCYDAQCRLTMQLYREDGSFIGSRFFRSESEIDLSLEAGETVYILFAATDVSSTNRRFKTILTDTGNTDMKLYEDAENGLYYRYSAEQGYAELYAAKNQPEQITLQQEVNGIPVSFMPEGVFSILPQETAVIGYAGCEVSKYADRYGFIYLEDGIRSDVKGDLNCDGRCSAADAVVMQALLAESGLLIPELVDIEIADLNADGTTDFLDYFDLLTLIGY